MFIRKNIRIAHRFISKQIDPDFKDLLREDVKEEKIQTSAPSPKRLRIRVSRMFSDRLEPISFAGITISQDQCIRGQKMTKDENEKNEYLDIATTLMLKMNEEGIEPSFKMYEQYFAMCSESKNLELAMDTYDEFVEKGFSCSSRIYNMLSWLAIQNNQKLVVDKLLEDAIMQFYAASKTHLTLKKNKILGMSMQVAAFGLFTALSTSALGLMKSTSLILAAAVVCGGKFLIIKRLTPQYKPEKIKIEVQNPAWKKIFSVEPSFKSSYEYFTGKKFKCKEYKLHGDFFCTQKRTNDRIARLIRDMPIIPQHYAKLNLAKGNIRFILRILSETKRDDLCIEVLERMKYFDVMSDTCVDQMVKYYLEKESEKSAQLYIKYIEQRDLLPSVRSAAVGMCVFGKLRDMGRVAMFWNQLMHMEYNHVEVKARYVLNSLIAALGVNGYYERAEEVVYKLMPKFKVLPSPRTIGKMINLSKSMNTSYKTTQDEKLLESIGVPDVKEYMKIFPKFKHKIPQVERAMFWYFGGLPIIIESIGSNERDANMSTLKQLVQVCAIYDNNLTARIPDMFLQDVSDAFDFLKQKPNFEYLEQQNKEEFIAKAAKMELLPSCHAQAAKAAYLAGFDLASIYLISRNLLTSPKQRYPSLEEYTGLECILHKAIKTTLLKKDFVVAKLCLDTANQWIQKYDDKVYCPLTTVSKAKVAYNEICQSPIFEFMDEGHRLFQVKKLHSILQTIVNDNDKVVEKKLAEAKKSTEAKRKKEAKDKKSQNNEVTETVEAKSEDTLQVQENTPQDTLKEETKSQDTLKEENTSEDSKENKSQETKEETKSQDSKEKSEDIKENTPQNTEDEKREKRRLKRLRYKQNKRLRKAT